MIDNKKAEKFAIDLAKKSGKVIFKHRDKIKWTDTKEKHDFVTNVDLESEKIILKAI